MNERQKKSFDYLVDISKQIITITTLFLGFSITLSKNLDEAECLSTFVLLSWIAFTLSIGGGILVFYGVLGHLSDKTTAIDDLDINVFNLRLFTGLQLIFFWLGIALSLSYLP